ncbi:hypothetical protein AMAG_00201 [Allomyces macrogynus ATCC 38327]|uniref:Uncharacterized protein n=1 Tax=Allomyces macrogynus (strain ATCC 38327) TaxID=578462 RepID=A0A0L0RVN7_ALLM3|nr:hypothetical protein AMAG_00201 [Allomyces macrogynus ATCC 38327]|eukprot:KNE54209.1 hypothetical protein AMAG_00201 [Allomyces macrogynus ATCC 38327]
MDVAKLLPSELLRDQFSAPGADPWTPPQAVREAAAAAADTPWMPTTSRPAAPYFASALLPKNPSAARMPVGAGGTGSAADANLMAMMMSMDPAFMERMAGMYLDADHGRPHVHGVDPNAMHRQQQAPRSRTFTAPVGLGLGGTPGSAAIPIRAPPPASGSGNAASRVSFAGGRAGQQQPAPIERPAPMRQQQQGAGGARPREDSGTASMFTGRSALMGSTVGGAANSFDPAASAGRRAGGPSSTAPSAHGSRTSSMYGQVDDLYSDPYAAQYAFQQSIPQQQQGGSAWSGRSSRTTSHAAPPPPPPPAAVQDPHARHRTGTGSNYTPAEMAAAFAAQYGMPAMDPANDYEALARMTQLPRSRMPSVAITNTVGGVADGGGDAEQEPIR